MASIRRNRAIPRTVASANRHPNRLFRTSPTRTPITDIKLPSLVCLTAGALGRRAWAWWGSVVYFGLLTLSAVVTLVPSRFSDMLSLMRLPPREMDLLKGVPLEGVHFAPFVGLPLVLTLGAIAKAKGD